MGDGKQRYWAAEPDSRDVVSKTLARIKGYREYLKATGKARRMHRSLSAFYGHGPDGQKSTAEILRGGEQGELSLMSPPVYQMLVRQTERLITGAKPAIKAIADNSDAATISQVVVAESVIGHYERTLALPELEVETVRTGLVMGSGWSVGEWATREGEPIGVDPDTKRVLLEGDAGYRTLTPFDVALDWRVRAVKERRWFAFRVPVNRWELAAQYPALADDIILHGTKADVDADDGAAELETAHMRNWRLDNGQEDVDVVWVWELRHLRTPALRQGRLVRFLSQKVVLYDSAKVRMPVEKAPSDTDPNAPPAAAETAEQDAGYPYPDLLAYEFCPERSIGAADGHSAHFDLLALQEALDMVATAQTTNINLTALINWFVPTGSVPNVHKLATGANIIEGQVEPKPILAEGLSQGSVAYAGIIQQWMRQAVGINDVAMGEVQKGMPAQLAALLEAKAVQFHEGGQRAFYGLVEANRTGILKLLQRFATSEKTATVVGRANSWALLSFKGDDLKAVERISIEPVNPVMRTFAGRMMLAESMADRQWLSREEYLDVYFTGELHEVFDERKAHMGRLSKEKELLAQGIGLPPVDMQQSMATGAPVFTPGEPGKTYIVPLVTDKHWVDIPEILSVLASPESRSNPAVVQATMDVVQEKLRLWRTMDPDLLALLGGPPAPSSQPPPGMGPPSPGGPPSGPPPSHKPPHVGAIPKHGGDVKQPSPPPSPVTGEQPPPPMSGTGVA